MWCCKTHCNGCMNVAWGWFWGGSRSAKQCVFPCKVAAAGDEGYLLCAAGAVWVVSKSIGSSSVLCKECKDAFSVAGTAQETCSSELLGGADFLRVVAFWSIRSVGLLR